MIKILNRVNIKYQVLEYQIETLKSKNIKVKKQNQSNLWKEIESSTHLWIHTVIVTWFIFSCSQTDDLDKNTPGACPNAVALPLYKPRKGVDQAREVQGQSLVNLGTASHHLMDREAVSRMSGLYWTYLIS